MGHNKSKFEPPRSEFHLVVKSVIKIQRWYRRYVTIMDERKKLCWKVFKTLEHARDAESFEIYKFYRSVIQYMGAKPGFLVGRRPTYLPDIENLQNVKLTQISDDLAYKYSGNFIKHLINSSEIQKVFEWVSKKRYFALHPGYVIDIIKMALPLLKAQPNINWVSIVESQQIIIVGKLSGNIDDLMMIFHKTGYPSPTNYYVFNGDFIGPGKRNCEVMVIILITIIIWPKYVSIHRGCNEDAIMILRNGFMNELQKKYFRNTSPLAEYFIALFRSLPLASIVNNEVLIIHGGITDKVALKSIQNLDRAFYSTMLEPPISDAFEVQNEWEYLMNVMWSYPNEGSDNGHSEKGFLFNEDDVESFFHETGFTMIIRSREPVVDGEEIRMNRKVLTIFSSSNYFGPSSNKGCYFIANAKGSSSFVKYFSGRKYNDELTFRESVRLLQDRALHLIAVSLYRHRNKLEFLFKKFDTNRSGVIGVKDWIKCLNGVSCCDIPWSLLLRRSVYNHQTDTVNYNETLKLLDNPEVVADVEACIIPYQCIVSNERSIRTLFFLLDKHNHGFIELKNFQTVCDMMESIVTSASHTDRIYKRVASMDLNKDGFVSYAEYLEAFDMRKTKTA